MTAGGAPAPSARIPERAFTWTVEPNALPPAIVLTPIEGRNNVAIRVGGPSSIRKRTATALEPSRVVAVSTVTREYPRLR